MQQDGTWGDHVILYAAANCYETCIQVISSLQHHGDLTIRPDRPVKSTKPLVLGHVHELHYVSLQPAIQGIAQYISVGLSVGHVYRSCHVSQAFRSLLVIQIFFIDWML